MLTCVQGDDDRYRSIYVKSVIPDGAAALVSLSVVQVCVCVFVRSTVDINLSSELDADWFVGSLSVVGSLRSCLHLLH